MRSRWQPTPGQLAQVALGLWLFGTGEALIISADLGNSPWTVFAQGVAENTPLTIGSATVVTSFFVLLCWIPLREWPGLGTLMNALGIGVAIDVTLGYLPHLDSIGVRWVSLLAGIVVVGLGSGLYLTAGLGPGPRDGLMTGLNRRFGWPLAAARTGIELTAFTVGFLLGGTAGAGTVLFALLIGHAVSFAVTRIGPHAAAPRVARQEAA